MPGSKSESGSSPAPRGPRRKQQASASTLYRSAPTRGRDAVTAEERDQPPGERPALRALEEATAHARPDQLALFTPTADGSFEPHVSGFSPLDKTSSLTLARSWYRHELELARRPPNTIESYSYDLMVLEHLIGPKPLYKIDRRDIARFLGEANSKTTRKRRLTSVRRLFRYLIDVAKVLEIDPTEGYYPHAIQLRSPLPLFAGEQEALMSAARADEPWSALAIWLMMRLGLTRSELLALRRDHIDRTSADTPIVFIYYDDLGKQGKERKLAANREFAQLYDAFLVEQRPEDTLFPVGPQAVNGMVERVRKAAGITKDVSPQTLRHTYAVDQARGGADQQQLLKLLGLADDPRNRASVQRYIRLAAPAVNEPLDESGVDKGATDDTPT